jgi:hypothetical protein
MSEKTAIVVFSLVQVFCLTWLASIGLYLESMR